MPVLLQPCGAVPKGTAPFYRLITDARFANKMYSEWGVTYTTAAQLSSTLNRCDFTFSIDISDAYHLALWAGCGGELRPIKRPVLARAEGGRPRVSWVDALVNGCTPSTCRGGCDKDMSGIMIEGHVFRIRPKDRRQPSRCSGAIGSPLLRETSHPSARGSLG